MKRKSVIATILAMTMVLSGCGFFGFGESPDINAMLETSEAATDDSARDRSSKEAVDNSSEDISEEELDETLDNSTISNSNEYSADEKDITGKYTAFLNGQESAECLISESQMPEYSGFKCEKGKMLDLNDIYDIILENSYNDSIEIDSYKYIDCGNDGTYELHLRLLSGFSGFNFVIKEYSDGLKLKYYAEEGEKYWCDIDELGHVSNYGKANASTAFDYLGFLNADAEYVHIYSEYYYLSAVDFWEEYGKGADSIWNDFQVEEFWFEEDYNNRKPLYSFYRYGSEDDDIVEDPSFYEPGSPYQSAFDEAGYVTCSQAEKKEMIEQRKLELGLTY